MGYVKDAPYVSGSDTSRAAAASVWTGLGGMELEVLRLIRRRGREGATDSEIEEALKMRHQTASARRRGLVLKGKVRDSGRRRQTTSGRMAAVWILGASETDKGASPERVPRPTAAEMRHVAAWLDDLKSQPFKKVRAWLMHLAAQEPKERT